MTANPVKKRGHRLNGNTLAKMAALGLIREANVVEA